MYNVAAAIVKRRSFHAVVIRCQPTNNIILHTLCVLAVYRTYTVLIMESRDVYQTC